MDDFTIVNLQDLTSVSGLSVNDLVAIGQGSKELKKATIQQLATILGVAESVVIGNKEVEPINPSFAFAEQGVYPEWGNTEIEGDLGILIYDGVSFSKTEINFIASGVVEEGNTQAVSGGEVFNNSVSEIYNVTRLQPLPEGEFYTSINARNAVPEEFRKKGLIIKYSTSYTNWVQEQFQYELPAAWGNPDYWTFIIDESDLKRTQTNYFLNSNDLSGYNNNSIINFGVYNYIDNGDSLYISIILKTPSLIQVFNQSDVLIAQYYNASTGIGIQEIELIKPNSTEVLFKAMVNWDIVKENDNLQKTLPINIKNRYVNDIEFKINNKFIRKGDFYLPSINLFDKNDPNILQEKWIPSNSTTGEPEDIDLVSILTGFIEANEGDTIHATLFNQPNKYLTSWFAIFDEDKNIITKSSILQFDASNNYSYTMQSGEKYIRFATRKTEMSLIEVNDLMVTIDQRVTSPYYPYGVSKNVNPQNTIVAGASRQGQTGVLFADSIGELSNWTNITSQITGANIINCAIGGTRMALHQITPNDYDAFSAYNLAEAVISGDWTRQIQAAIDIKNNTGDDNIAIVNRMVDIDWNTVDFIMLGFGTNDLTGGNPIGTDTDNTGTTIKGAMNLFLTKILTEYPNIEILGITPIYRNVEGVSSDTWVNGNGDTLIDIVEAEQEIFKKYKVDYESMYYNLGINNLTIDTYLPDGTHLSEFGASKYGLKIANKLG